MAKVTCSPIRRVISVTYTEEGCEPIPPFRPSDEEYGRMLQRCIPLCVDVVIVDSLRRILYLAKRTSKPWSEIWWIGGGMNADDDILRAAAATFKRETGVEVAPERLELVARNNYRYKDRAQPPLMGCHMEGCVFAVALTEVELASLILDPNEYDQEFGLRSFDREQLVTADVHPAILHVYDAFFPPE